MEGGGTLSGRRVLYRWRAGVGWEEGGCGQE